MHVITQDCLIFTNEVYVHNATQIHHLFVKTQYNLTFGGENSNDNHKKLMYL